MATTAAKNDEQPAAAASDTVASSPQDPGATAGGATASDATASGAPASTASSAADAGAAASGRHPHANANEGGPRALYERYLAEAMAAPTPPGKEPLSKNARKRAAKKRASEAFWVQKRQAEKAAKAERKAEKQEWFRRAKEALPAEQLMARLDETKRRVDERKSERKHAREDYDARLAASRHHLVIDLSFEAKMGQRELKSCVQQCMYAYGLNKRAATPWHLHFTGLKKGSAQEREFQKIGGFDSWKVDVSEQHYTELFETERLVYLTADAGETMSECSTSKVYIIGGIVDRNVHSGLTQERAGTEGIATERLPLTEHLDGLKGGTTVLTVDTMVNIMVGLSGGGGFAEVLTERCPHRKH